MIACIDVDYDEDAAAQRPTWARAACVVIEAWTSSSALAEYLCQVDDVADYVPGRFYERELPCVLAVLDQVTQPLDRIIVDGYVQLDAGGARGMGAHLYEALDRRIPIIGVAKHPFRDNDAAIELLRGTSKRPLYITAIGVAVEAAVEGIRRMHGQHRLPSVLKRVDRLCRDGK